MIVRCSSDLVLTVVKLIITNFVIIKNRVLLVIKIHEEDYDFTIFFWPVDPCDPESELVVIRFKVVLFGLLVHNSC